MPATYSTIEMEGGTLSTSPVPSLPKAALKPAAAPCTKKPASESAPLATVRTVRPRLCQKLAWPAPRCTSVQGSARIPVRATAATICDSVSFVSGATIIFPRRMSKESCSGLATSGPISLRRIATSSAQSMPWMRNSSAPAPVRSDLAATIEPYSVATFAAARLPSQPCNWR